MKDSDYVQRLIRLKRYESPGVEYFQQFAEDFKDRQRAVIVKQSSRALLAERVSLWFEEMGSAKWLVPTGAAAAVGAGLFFAIPGENENELPASAIAETSTDKATMPSFPESTDEIFHLKIPKAVPPAIDKNVLPANARGALREL